MPLTRASDGSLGVKAAGGKDVGGKPPLSIQITQHIQIDSRSDRAQIMEDMMRLKDVIKAELTDELSRSGHI